MPNIEKVLKIAPNRFNTLWGAAKNAESIGDANTAPKYYQKVVEVGVGNERAEMETARKQAKMIAQK